MIQAEKSWIDLVEKFGWPSVILLAVGFFVWKWLLPLITKQIEKREADLDKFMVSMDTHQKGLNNVADALKSLRDEIQSKRR